MLNITDEVEMSDLPEDYYFSSHNFTQHEYLLYFHTPQCFFFFVISSHYFLSVLTIS